MPVPSTIADLSTSEASNHPLDTESITATTRPSDYLRAHATIIKTHTTATAEHGATGAVVGTTNTQTLTNKTLTAPAINGTVTTSGLTLPAFTSGAINGTTIPTSKTLLTTDDLLNEANMASNSATDAPSQQSVKAYVDAQVAAGGIGASQTWKDVKTTPGRALNTTYTNTTGKPIAVAIQTTNTGSSQAILTVGGVAVYGTSPGTATAGFTMIVSAIVPAGATYIASNTNQTLDHWRELTA